jgi:signal recognition particle subunit SRP54
MGDVLSFIERAEQSLDEKKAAELEKKLAKNKFDLNDLLDQFAQIERMGSLKDTIKMIPGVGNKIKDEDIDEKAFDKFKAIIYSMTMQERTHPDIINPSRKRRIAKGCGMQVEDVNKLLSQFKQMQKMMKQFGGGKGGPKVSKKMRRMMQANPQMAEKMMGKMGGSNPFGI